MTYSAHFISKYFPDTAKIQEETDRIFQLSQNFNSVIIVDDNNNLVTFSPESNVPEVNKLVADTGHSPRQPDSVAASLPYETDENDYAIALSAPIVSEEGVYLGDIRGAIHLTKLRIMDEFTPLNNDRSMIYIIDNEGNTIYHYNNKVPLGQHINDRQLKQATASQDTGSFMMPDEQGNLVLAGFAKVHKTGWTVITLHSSAVTDKALNNVMYSVLKEAAPVALLTLLVLTIFAVSIARPLRQLAMSASRMSEQGAISQIRAVPSWYVEAVQLKDAILLGTMMLHKRIGVSAQRRIPIR
ncbi:cache domain-containing protein [Lonsdalea populi]|uniref:cache domain-containing protein n=1 Tax=Lonsdalea populi TaxID=1172565 RepID=UPI0021ABB07E|nr:cache domain-containing protein [Lonsdalea populi]